MTAARNFGFVFRSRTPDSVSIVEMGEQRRYELLAILDFNNVRKRMSVIGTPPPPGPRRICCRHDHTYSACLCAQSGARRGSYASTVKVPTRSSTRGCISPAAS